MFSGIERNYVKLLRNWGAAHLSPSVFLHDAEIFKQPLAVVGDIQMQSPLTNPVS